VLWFTFCSILFSTAMLSFIFHSVPFSVLMLDRMSHQMVSIQIP
jgi:hypothetical protein